MAVRSAPAPGTAPKRAQLSVAELLGRDAPRSSEPSEPVTVPETWPLPVGSSRLRLARTAGAYLVAGSVVCAAAFGGHATDGPTLGSETADGGPPTGTHSDVPEQLGPPEQPRAASSDRPTSPARVAPSAPKVRPAARVAHPPASATSSPLPRRTGLPRRRPPVEGADRGGLRVPAGSALSSLTRPIVGSDTLLNPLG